MLVRCQHPHTGQDSKLLLLDYMTDAVLAQFPNLAGRIYVTPDSRKLVALQDGKHGVDIVVMRITGKPHTLSDSFRYVNYSPRQLRPFFPPSGLTSCSCFQPWACPSTSTSAARST